MDGSQHPYSAGSLISIDGKKINLTAADVKIEVTEHWDSPLGGR